MVYYGHFYTLVAINLGLLQLLLITNKNFKIIFLKNKTNVKNINENRNEHKLNIEINRKQIISEGCVKNGHCFYMHTIQLNSVHCMNKDGKYASPIYKGTM